MNAELAVSEPVECPPRKRGGGPKTEEGKRTSRRNALKDGTRAKVVLPPEMEAAARVRQQEIADHFKADGPYDHWLVGRMAFASVQLDRCQQMTLEDLAHTIRRAELFWDDDRNQHAVDLAARLPRDPQRVAIRLRQTRQGAQWLIDQWEDLGSALEVNETWDEDQRRIAFDMLGVHPALRDGFRRVPEPSNRAGLVALVEREVDRLREQQEHALDELDQYEQMLAASGMPIHESATTKRLRKYETAIKREWKQAHDELLTQDPAAAAAFAATLPAAAEDRRVESPPPPAVELESMPYFYTDDEMFDYHFKQAQEHQSPEIHQMFAVMEALDAEAREMARAEAAGEVVHPDLDLDDDDDDAEVEQPEQITPVAPAVSTPAPAAPKTFRGNRRQRRAQASRARKARRR